MKQYLLNKKRFDRFFKAVVKSYDFIAPVRGDPTKQDSKSMFSKVKDSKEIFLGKITTYFPAKYLFFDKKEVMFEFKGNKIIDPKLKLRQRVIFGLRRCDLNGIKHQDIVFIEEAKEVDPFYKKRRDASLLIGYHCKEGDEYCFCNSVELVDFFDLMFYDKGKKYVVEVGSVKGKEFIEKYRKYFKETGEVITEEDRKIVNYKKLDSVHIKEIYYRPEWKELSKKCLSCGACNHLCPNCHCFDIYDEVDFDLKTGRRVRVPESCQLKPFTRVAGDHIFRESRLARFRHRIYHQIEYFRDRHNIIFCTGCGRCIRGCPVRIDWVKGINDMKR